MARMGAHGEGGVTRRRDGRLQVSITIRGHRIYRMVPRMRDPKRQARLAERIRRELAARYEADLDPAGQTLADYLHSWLASMASATYPRRPNTIAYYRAAVAHIVPGLGKIPLDRLTVRHVQEWIDRLTISPRYVSHCRATLRRALNVAQKQRLIADNPARWVDLPPIPEFRGAPLTAAEAHALLEATVADRLGALWRLALVTGLRSAELLALSWDDIAGGTVTVTTQLQRQDGEWKRVKTKTARGLERVAIDADTVRALEAHRVRQAAERKPEWPYWGLVFTTRNGYPLDRHEVLVEFRQACDRAGIPRRRFHDLRGSTATIMGDLGVAEDVRMARLGHSTKAMARHYGQASERQDREAVEKLARAIG